MDPDLVHASGARPAEDDGGGAHFHFMANSLGRQLVQGALQTVLMFARAIQLVSDSFLRKLLPFFSKQFLEDAQARKTSFVSCKSWTSF